jgi:hypothetical protein
MATTAHGSSSDQRKFNKERKDDAMTQIMTPSKTTTDGQIDKAVASYRALLEKHSKEFGAEAVQTVLGQPEFTNEQFAVFRRRIEAVSNLIVRKVVVDRSRTPQEALDATGRVQYTNREVVDNMPKVVADEAEVVFFKPDLSGRDGHISDDDLEKEFELRGLKPADPIPVAAVNEADPDFADKIPHGTHWRDADGKWCFAAFNRWSVKRVVNVRRDALGWDGSWWFAGVRK